MRTRLSALLALIVLPVVDREPPPEYTFRGTVVTSDGTPADGALGEAALEKQDTALARECLGTAVDIDPNYPEPSMNPARVTAREERWVEAGSARSSSAGGIRRRFRTPRRCGGREGARSGGRGAAGRRYRGDRLRE